jgi:photoactive yellow protein
MFCVKREIFGKSVCLAMNKKDFTTSFEQDQLLESLVQLDSLQLDALPFGVIGFKRDYLISRYNHFESQSTGLEKDYVLGKHVFTEIAQCMNNFMVAQRFADAWGSSSSLDESMGYVLTWRMKPTKVKLRLLSAEKYELAFIALSPRSPVNT